MSGVTRLYALALRAFPASHRASYGAEMLDAFSRALASEAQHGAWRACHFTIAASADAIRSGISERRRMRDRAGRLPLDVFGSMLRDLVHAVRSLSRARAFTVVSAASLGIGIGAVILMLALARLVVGTPPGVKEDGLVELIVIPQGELRARVGDWAIDTWSYPDFDDLAEGNTAMTLAGWVPGESVLSLPDGGGGMRADAIYVTPNYFAIVGVPLARGPGLAPNDGSRAEVIVSHRFWQRHLAADPQVIGRTLVVNRTAHVIVGVTPDGFDGHLAMPRIPIDVWLPLQQHPRLAGAETARFSRDVDWVRVIGRLSPGTTLADARGAVASIMEGIAQRHPATNALKSVSVEPYVSMGARRRTDVLGEIGTIVVGSWSALLIVCLNMSGMLLVRSATRERELAVRLAIGARRGRLIQYLLAEAVVLAVLGGALAIAVVFGTPQLLSWWFDTPLGDETPRLDGVMLGACLGLCLLTSIVFGLMPAIRFSRPSMVTALKDEAAGGRRVGRVHRWTAAIQAGIAVPFLVIGAVRLDQIRVTASADLGFDPKGLFAVPVDLTAASGGPRDETAVIGSIRNRLSQATGVSSVAVASGLPLDSQPRETRITVEGESNVVRAHTTRVTAEYFETMGVRVLRGRGISTEDRQGAEPVAVISEPLAVRLFPDGRALGRRITFALEGGQRPSDFRWDQRSTPLSNQTFTVVGVTEDMAAAWLEPGRPQLFVPLAQQPVSRVFVLARSTTLTERMQSAFVGAMADLDVNADVVRSSLVTGDRIVERGRGDLAFGWMLAGIGSGVALLLAALGIFGVVGFMVATRTREIGIRIALGATRARVLRGVLIDAVKLVSWGVVAGLTLAYVFVREFAWGSMGIVEPIAYAVAAAITLGVAAVAALPAAQRAAAVEPIIAMRTE